MTTSTPRPPVSRRTSAEKSSPRSTMTTSSAPASRIRRRLGRRRRHRDGEGAGELRQLHAVQAEPSPRSRHQHMLPDPHAADIANRVEFGPDRASDDGGLFGGRRRVAPQPRRRHRRRRVRHSRRSVRHRQERSAPGRKSRGRHGNGGNGRRLVVDRGGNEITAAKLAHLRAEPLDSAGHLMAEDDRHSDAAPKRAVAHHDVVEADAAGGDRDPDLTRSRLARRHIGDAQDIWGTGSFDDDGTHQDFRRSVRPEPAGDDLPLAALGLHDRARQCAGMLGC